MNSKIRSFRYNLAYWIIAIILTIMAILGLFQFKRANALENSQKNSYNRAFYELSDSVASIDVLLEKIMLAQTPTQISALSSDIYAQSEAAKTCLSQLPIEHGTLENTSKFLSQAGDYCSYISAKVTDSGTVTEEEFNNLLKLSEHANTINTQINALLLNLDNKDFWNKKDKNTVYADSENAYFADGLKKIEKEFVNYPSLIYDGPFSEHIEKLDAEAIKDKDAVSTDVALEIAKLCLGESRAQNLSLTGEINNSLKCFSFSSQKEDRQIAIDITQKGGLPVWFLDSRSVENSILSIDEAKQAGMRFLKRLGFTSMQESYFERAGNTVTLNYAFSQDGIIMYSDLLKLKIALDNGEVIGFESRGYIMSHKIREIPQNIMPQKEAQEKLSSHISVESARLAMIPKESKREVLCYEFKGKFNNRSFLIYLNAVTGKDEKILMLTENENGTLVV